MLLKRKRETDVSLYRVLETAELPDGSIDEETQLIMEMNFNQYINALADILVKYASDFD